jgi:aconitate hydratase
MEGKNAYDEEQIKQKLIRKLNLDKKEISYYSLPALKEIGMGDPSRLPFSLRIVLESLVRNMDGQSITKQDVINLLEWEHRNPKDQDIPFKVSRVLMQDFTGVPAVVDMAAIRDFIIKKGGKPDDVQPIIPTDLIIDHSVQVDSFNVVQALEINQEKEIERNSERYKLLKWASQGFNNFKVFPPSAGICHQVNLEFLATCVATKASEIGEEAFPDTLVGTDSHTTMVDSLGIVGFGVGGIEAEAALLGQPVSITMPKVLGVHLKNRLPEGATATDFALTLTKLLREKGVVNMFVEFFGEGLKSLSLPDRATLSNMCPEYGATVAIFPVDDETLKYLEMTGRPKSRIELIKEYYKAQGMLNLDYKNIDYSDILEVDLSAISPSVSGPSQPKQQIPLSKVKEEFISLFLDGMDPKEIEPSGKELARWSSESINSANNDGNVNPHEKKKSATIKYHDGTETILSDGDIVISSITSCTNTSNPSVMIAAGLLAKKALEKGLKINTRKVKTSMGPGSRVVTRYLQKAGLIEPLEKLGYEIVGYGCITCIGNSGPLIDKQSEAINSNDLNVVAVLSGNRNYEARIHTDVKANYLMSPPLLIAFAIAGTILIDLTKEPLGKNEKGEPVYLKDIWPTNQEINEIMGRVISEDMFEKEYGKNIYDVNPYWNSLQSPSGKAYVWEKDSTYVRLPPFFDSEGKISQIAPIENARVLAIFGDSISTDHISPAGAISSASPAGKYLIEQGVKPADFNTYGSRRGNHEVMMRGTFANSRIVNLMLDGGAGGNTIHYPSGEKTTIYDAAMRYKKENVPEIVIAGLEYGSGSSRDWAAKGTALLGVKAIIAKSFERIHRSNLIGMGVVPLQFREGESAESLMIDYSKTISININENMKPRDNIKMSYYKRGSDSRSETELELRIDTGIEMEYYRAGGILNYVVKKLQK